MQKKTSYVAFDGKEFDKESKCIEYENGYVIKASNIVMLDDCMKLLLIPSSNVTDLNSFFDYALDYVRYILFADEDTKNAYINWCNYLGYCVAGLGDGLEFVFNDITGRYEPMMKQIDNLTNAHRTMQTHLGDLEFSNK